MKIKRVVISAVLCILLIFDFSGCSVLDTLNEIFGTVQVKNGPGQAKERADILRKEYSATIIDALKSNDIDALKEVLCTKTQGISDIDNQINDGLAFIEGSITEYTVAPEMSGEGMGWDYGVVTLCECYGNIYKVKTDADKWYEINFHMYYIVESDDRKGVTQIVLRDTQNTNDYNVSNNCYDDDTFFYIGYRWNESYIGDSNGLAYEAIKAISAGDITALRQTYCTKSLESSVIESQMQQAFEFFDGAAAFGETQKNGETYYDGKDDFHITACKDRVIIENRKEALVYVEVYIVNIQTDTGKIYQMELAGYLKNDKDSNLKGIVYLNLIDAEKSVTVGTKPTSELMQLK